MKNIFNYIVVIWVANEILNSLIDWWKTSIDLPRVASLIAISLAVLLYEFLKKHPKLRTLYGLKNLLKIGFSWDNGLIGATTSAGQPDLSIGSIFLIGVSNRKSKLTNFKAFIVGRDDMLTQIRVTTSNGAMDSAPSVTVQHGDKLYIQGFIEPRLNERDFRAFYSPLDILLTWDGGKTTVHFSKKHIEKELERITFESRPQSIPAYLS